MRIRCNVLAVSAMILALGVSAGAQTKQKPGLWVVTTTMSMGGEQMPQMPQNVQLPPGVNLPPGVQMPQNMGSSAGSMSGSPMGSQHTSQVCVTQAMIDKFGGPNPAPVNPHADCKTTSIVQKSNGMSATITCTGQMNATGTVEATYVDANTTKSTIHITGTMQMGGNSSPVDMSMQSTSVYKGPDCGSVKPMTMPTGK